MNTYLPEIIEVKKDSIYGAIHALEIGLEYTKKMMWEDIRLIEKVIKDLK